MPSDLEGVICPIATPFTEDDNQVSESGLRYLVDGMIAAGILGLIPCGSTGEFPALCIEERKHITEIVVDQARSRVPVIPHTGSTSTREAVELSIHAEKAGAFAVMVVQPYYGAASYETVYGYFKDISDSINIPIMVYNSPACTGVNLRPSFLAQMGREIKSVRYVKDTTGDLAQFCELLYKYNQDITVLEGSDLLIFASLLHGSKTVSWGTANVMPHQCVELFKLVQGGQFHRAQELWCKLWPVVQFIETEGYVASVKAGANLIGFRVGNPRRPLHPLSREKTEQLKRLLTDVGAVTETEDG